MTSENREHPALILGAQVEEAVPCQNAIKRRFRDNFRMSMTIQF
jgi:hypothetical protein